MFMLELNLEKAIEEIRKRKASKVAVQLPEGLKTRALEIAEKLEGAGATVFTFIDPCYGACDLVDAEAKALGAELLLHFGHTPFLQKTEVETVYLPLNYKIPKGMLVNLADKLSKVVKERKIALCSTAQYLHLLQEFKRALEKKGFSAEIGKGKGVERGQVLGCNYSSVKAVEGAVKAVVFLGDGLFHPLGISFSSSKKVFTANPLSGEVKELEGERELFLKKRNAAIAVAMQAKSFGILLSTKQGQLRTKLALELKKKLEKKGLKAFLLAGNLIKGEYVLGIKVEALVSTACPRIALDDSSSYKVPVLNPTELLIALGEKKLEQYNVEELQ